MVQQAKLFDQARDLDRSDPLRDYRNRFSIPRTDGVEQAYVCGNSLGLAPRRARTYLTEEIDAWETKAVRGHFEGERPWLSFHEPLAEPLGRLVGAEADEVVCTGTLTANLHALLASFYQPTATRHGILIEEHAFPSDRYAASTWLEARDLKAEDSLFIARRSSNNDSLSDAVLRAIDLHADQLATVFVGGVHYQSGEVLDMERIAERARAEGIAVVLDLAHAIGNVPLKLHDWNVDAAAWCSYKYLNSGPGAAAGLFVHEDNFDAFRLGGWWGHEPATRFDMPHAFKPQRGAAGWQWSNAPVFSMAPIYASLEIFSEVDDTARYRKSEKLFDFLTTSLESAEIPGLSFRTPVEAGKHGAQLSIAVDGDSEALEHQLLEQGVVCDHRPPNILRVAPVPLYNSFEDIARFVDALSGLTRPD